MQTVKNYQRTQKLAHRSGAVVVEAALILPMLIGITFGAVDIAQYINLSQIVANASRVGALKASDRHTLNVAEIETAVRDFMADSVAGLSTEEMANAVVVQVLNGSGESVPAGDLSNIDSGASVQVSVAFDFSTVRWLKGPDYWNANVQDSVSVGRRE